MDKDIYFEQQALGHCKIEKEGGYYRIDAHCTYKDGIFRLYMTTPQQFTRLGVMMPEFGELHLTRRISPHELGIAPQDGELILMPGTKTPPLTDETPGDSVAPNPQAAQAPSPDAGVPSSDAGTAEAAETPDAGTASAEQSVETQQARAEDLSDSPSGLIDRWCACENASDFTNDAILKPLLSTLEGVLYRYRGGGVELAVPAQAAGAISAVLCLTRAEQIRDENYFIVSLDRQGLPSPASAPSKY